MTIKRIIFLLTITFTGVSATGQDPEFSQFYASPVYMNPAFSGTTYNPRFHINYRDQWPGLDHAYVTYSASYDQYFDFLSGGIGLIMTGDRAGNGIYNTFSASGSYAYQLNLSPQLAMRAGFQAGIIQRSIDMSRVLFYDQIDPVTGFYNNGVVNPTGEIFNGDPVVQFADFSVGALVFNENIFGGIAVKHLTQPIQSFNGNSESYLPMRFTIHGGGVFELDEILPVSDVTISPNFMYTEQSGFRQFNVGSYVKKDIIFGGFWFRHNISNSDAVILLAGLQYGVMKFGYSYDFTINNLNPGTGGSHEVSLIINLDDMEGAGNRNRRENILKCPNLF